MFDIDSIYQATSVQDAIKALQADETAEVIAGGSDVLIKIREGKMAGCRLVSIHGIRELSGVTLEGDGTIVIRPLTTFAGVTESDVVQKHIPTLGFATDQAGGPQLRNIGTIGGNVCNGVTSADSAATLLTLNARLVLEGPDGVRRVQQEDFYAGPGRVHKERSELLTAIEIPKADYDGFFGHYIKYAQRNAMDIATLGCAVHVKLTADKKKVEELRLGYGVAGPTPLRCRETEKKAAGMALGSDLLDAVSKGALAETNPRTSWRASKEFRQQLISELARRALTEAVHKAGGEIA